MKNVSDITPAELPKGRVLFVDDEPALLRSIERTLHPVRNVWECEFSPDPLSALAQLEKGRFSVVVADMRMPGMSGAEMLEKACAIAPETVRMMLTVSTDLPTALEAVNRGHVFQFLVKPCEGSRLIGALASAIRQYSLQNAERELLRVTLEHADKMNLVGRMAAGINHDLNNIILAISLHADFALTTPQNLEELNETLRTIKQAAGQASELTGQLRRFSRRDETPVAEELEIKRVIESSVCLVLPMLRERIELQIEIPDNLPTVFGDARQLRQVLVNLILNARDAITNRGRIRITAQKCLSMPNSALSDAQTRSFVRLSVADNGTGMDEATQKRLFEPFFTTKPAGSGTGLGLFIARRLLEQNHGSITVESRLGEGTTFHLFLPS